MKKSDRHHIIISEVQIRNRVLLTDLATLLKVSIDTVRRDVTELDTKNKLKKVHGGAISNSFKIYNTNDKDIYALNTKAIIAKKGLSLIQEGAVILISGGSTNLELVKLLPNHLNLTFFTPSLPMAIQLINNPNNTYDVYFIGGKLSRNSQLATGGNTINMLSEIVADICFLGTGYLDPIKGITEIDWEIAQMKKAMIKASKQTVTLAISEKLNTANRYKIDNLTALSTLVTELNPSHDLLKPYANMGVNLI